MDRRSRGRGGTARPCQAVRAALIYAECRYVESARTVFLPVPIGDIWRVQIVWPNASVLFGRFASERQAREWIANHTWWAKYKLKPPEDDVREVE
jgi:hypothetical protein